MTKGNASWGKGYHDGFDDGESHGVWQGRVEGVIAAAVVAGSVWAFRRRQVRRAARGGSSGLARESAAPRDDRREEPTSLTAEAARLLQHIGQAPAPLAMSDHFVLLNPSPHGFGEHHPEHPAWTERQLAYYAASVEVMERGLVYVVTPADGSRPDLVDLTPAGLAVVLRL